MSEAQSDWTDHVKMWATFLLLPALAISVLAALVLYALVLFVVHNISDDG